MKTIKGTEQWRRRNQHQITMIIEPKMSSVFNKIEMNLCYLIQTADWNPFFSSRYVTIIKQYQRALFHAGSEYGHFEHH